MEIALGFLIAFIIAITGVGAGTITAPMLILLLHVPVAISVGTALAYSTIVKAVVVPVQIWRKQVAWRVLWNHAAGRAARSRCRIAALSPLCCCGRPCGFLCCARAHHCFLCCVASLSSLSSACFLRRTTESTRRAIAALMFPIAAEVGFASSGAGAMGTLVLMGLSSLDAAKVVGTDLAFAFCMTLTGSGIHFASGFFDTALLLRLTIGGVAGALAGSMVAPRVPSRQLRLALSVCLVLLGLGFCYRAFAQEAAVRGRTSVSESAVVRVSRGLSR